MADISGSYATGSLILGASGNTATTTRPGRLGQALSFDGTNDYVSVANIVPLRVSTGPVAAWAFRNDATNGKQYVIFNYPRVSNPSAAAYLLYAYDDSNQLILYLDNTAALAYTFGASAKHAKRWVHYAATWDGSIVSLYGDGKLVATTTQTATLTYTNPAAPRIGDDDSTSHQFRGSLDDVRVYNRAITAAEAKRLYDMGK
ncbi:MAG TPA: LamG domain-containing protein [Candidatus Paceibacterota bacterium]